jgi:hypothetical protein
MKTLLPLEQYEQDPQFSALDPKGKDQFYTNYFSTAESEIENEDDANQLLKWKADRYGNNLKAGYQALYPEDTKFDEEKIKQHPDLNASYEKYQSSYAELHYNQDPKHARTVKPDDMEDPTRSFSFKPYKFGGKTGYSMLYPDGSSESVPGIANETQLTDFLLEKRVDKFDGKRQGILDQLNPVADSELDSVYNKIRNTTTGIEGVVNEARKGWSSIVQGGQMRNIKNASSEAGRSDRFLTALQKADLRIANAKDPEELEEAHLQKELIQMGTQDDVFDKSKQAKADLPKLYKDLFDEMTAASEIQGSQTLSQYQDYIEKFGKSEQKEAGTFLKYFQKNPDEILPYITSIVASSAPDLGLGVASGIGGAVVGGPAGAAVGAGSYGFAREYTATTLSEIQERAADENAVLSPDLIEKYLNDTEFMKGVESKALTRAGVIGTADAALGGIVAKLSGKIQGATRRAMFGAGAGAVSESAGEGAAQAATDGELNWSEIINEGLGGLGTAPVAVAVGAYQDRKANNIIEAKEQADVALNAAKGYKSATNDTINTVNQEARERLNEMERKVQSTESPLSQEQKNYVAQSVKDSKDYSPVNDPKVPQEQAAAYKQYADEVKKGTSEATTPADTTDKAPDAAQGSFDRKAETETKPTYKVNGIQKGFNDKDEIVPMYQLVTIDDPTHYFDGSTITVPLGPDGTASEEAILQAIEKKKEQEFTDRRGPEEDIEVFEEDKIENQAQLTEKGPGVVFKALDWFNSAMGLKPKLNLDNPATLSERAAAQKVKAYAILKDAFKGGMFSLLSDTKSYDRIMREVVASNYDSRAVGRMMDMIGLDPADAKARVITNALGNFWSAGGIDMNDKNMSDMDYNGLLMSEAIDKLYREQFNVTSLYDMPLEELDGINENDLLINLAPDSIVEYEDGSQSTAQAAHYQVTPSPDGVQMSIDEAVKRFNASFNATPVRAPEYNDALNDKFVEATEMKRPGIYNAKLSQFGQTGAQIANNLFKWMGDQDFMIKDSAGHAGRNVTHSRSAYGGDKLGQTIQAMIDRGEGDGLYMETAIMTAAGKESQGFRNTEHRVHVYVDASGKARAFRNLTFNKKRSYFDQMRDPSEDTFFLIPDDPNSSVVKALQEYAEKILSGKDAFKDMIFGLDMSFAATPEGPNVPFIFEANALTYGMSGWLGNPLAMSEIMSEFTGRPSVLAGLYEIAKTGLSKSQLTDIYNRIEEGMPAEYVAMPEYYDAVMKGVAVFNRYISAAKWLTGMQSAFRVPRDFLKSLWQAISKAFRPRVDRRFYREQARRAGRPIDTFDREFPAHHGTPNEFDGEFSLDKIGTGEGTQFEGWGLYFSESKDVAEWYKKELGETTYNGLEYDPWNASHKAALEIDRLGSREAAIDKAKEMNAKDASPDMKAFRNEVIKHIENNTEAITSTKGNVYTVDIIPEKDHFMRWNSELGNQSKYVQDKIKEIFSAFGEELQLVLPQVIGNDDVITSKNWKEFTGAEFYRSLENSFNNGDIKNDNGKYRPYEQLEQRPLNSADPSYRGDKEASLMLAQFGIPGNKYFSAESTEANEVFNYVVFDDKLIKKINDRQSPSKRRPANQPASLDKAFLTPRKDQTLGQYIDQVLQHPQLTENESAVLNYIRKKGHPVLQDSITVARSKRGYNFFDIVQGKVGVLANSSKQIIIHEIVHAVTSNHIDLNTRNAAEVLSKGNVDKMKGTDFIDLYREIIDPANREALLDWGISKDYLNLTETYVAYLDAKGLGSEPLGYSDYEYQKKNSKRIPYGAINIDEFAAETMTSKKFQRDLASLPPTRGNHKSMLSQVWKTLARVLGIPFHKDSLLVQAIGDTAGVISNKNNSKIWSRVIQDEYADGTKILRSNSEADLTELDGVTYKRDEVSQETVEKVRDADTTAEVDTASKIAAEEAIQAKISQLTSEFPELLKGQELTAENLPVLYEMAIEYLEGKMDAEDAEGVKESDLTEKKLKEIEKLQANKLHAIRSLRDWLNNPGITDAQGMIVADAMEYIMEQTEDPEALTTTKLKFYNNVMASMSSGAPPVFKHVITRMFNKKMANNLRAIRSGKKRRVQLQAPMGDWRAEVLFGVFNGELGSLAQQATEVAYMGLSNLGHKFLRDYMGFYKDQVDTQQLEEAAVNTEFSDFIVSKFGKGKFTNLNATRIGVVARLTQYNKLDNNPLNTIVRRTSQLTEGIKVQARQSVEDGAISQLAVDQILNGTDLAQMPDEAAAISFLESQLTANEKAVLDKIRQIGQRYMPALQTVKAITKASKLDEYVNYVHDSNVTPQDTSEQNMLKVFDSMSDVLHDRKGLEDGKSFANLDIRTIANNQIKSSTYEKHTGMQRYMMVNSLSNKSPLPALLDADTNTIDKPITNRLKKLMATYHNAMTKTQHQFNGVFGVMDSAANLMVGSLVLGVNAATKNFTAALASRFSLFSLGRNAFIDSFKSHAHGKEIKEFLKAHFPTQYNRTNQYDIIDEAKDTRNRWRNKVQTNMELGDGFATAVARTGAGIPKAALDTVSREVLSRLSNVSNGLPERFHAFAMWTGAYVHYMKQNGTARDLQDFLTRKVVDRRAATDASDFVNRQLGYAPDKASKGSFWNASTAQKKIISKSLMVFRQQASGISFEFQNNMQKAARLFATGNVKEGSQALLLAGTAFLNVATFRALTTALSTVMFYGGLSRYFNAGDDEETKRALLEAQRAYQANSYMNNIRDFATETLMMIVPMTGAPVLVENAIAGGMDYKELLFKFDGEGFGIEQKKVLKEEIKVIEAEIAKLEKAARTKEENGLNTEPEDDAIEKLELAKTQLTEKTKFKYFPNRPDKAFLAAFGGYGIATEGYMTAVKDWLGEDITDEEKVELRNYMEQEFTLTDPIAGMGYGANLINDLSGYLRKLAPSEMFSDKGSIPNELFWKAQLKMGQNPKVVVERAQAALAKKFIEDRRRRQKAAEETEKQWADKYRE